MNIRVLATQFVESKFFKNFILATIIFNSILLGVMTDVNLMEKHGHTFELMSFICVIIFTLEMFIKQYVYKMNYFKDGWNIFDFLIVLISWVPTSGAFSSFRAFRVLRTLRTLRLISQLEKLRMIVQAIIVSIPHVSWASLLLLLIFYIFSIMGTMLFSVDFPDWFGNVGKSMYSLFQIMTLESWSMGIARPVIAVQPHSWVFFVTFILVSSFIVMNVIVGVVVNAIGSLADEAKAKREFEEKSKMLTDENCVLEVELIKMREQIDRIETLLKMQKGQNN